MSSNEGSMARVTAVASGKGGVGKTNVSVNLAVALARQGERTILVDCDMGLANAGILMGLDGSWTIADLLARHCSLEDAVRTGPGGLRFLPGHSGTGIGSTLSAVERRRLIGALRAETAGFDHVIIDTGGGLGADGLALVAEADRALIVLAPEPTSFMDAYALVKALAVGHERKAFCILTNMVENDQAGAELFDHFETVITRFLDVKLTHAGSVPDDRYVRESVFRKRCCVEAFPSSRAAKAFTRLAGRVAARQLPAFFTGRPAASLEPCHGAR